ncbi:hypothetical protein GALMADRAFT_1199567 [Galerina marginata CBS 339.88]|uniref:Uncharacterized protein n=1 Tax=Galerina marginata (strain CBS 339.88) TaxID=685588 RepID=A0A067TBD5_GALM3|nr:hypothetical protein GALMADRAFT_1199567 [Galerina marginata CBS 339.88]
MSQVSQTPYKRHIYLPAPFFSAQYSAHGCSSALNMAPPPPIGRDYAKPAVWLRLLEWHCRCPPISEGLYTPPPRHCQSSAVIHRLATLFRQPKRHKPNLLPQSPTHPFMHPNTMQASESDAQHCSWHPRWPDTVRRRKKLPIRLAVMGTSAISTAALFLWYIPSQMSSRRQSTPGTHRRGLFCQY